MTYVVTVTLGLLLLVACAFAIIRQRIGLPCTNGLILFWCGLRGALALAIPAPLPEHEALIGVAFAVVAFATFVQSATMPLLLRVAKASSGDPR